MRRKERKPPMPQITVTHRTGSLYDVTVRDERSATHHEVTVWPSDIERYSPGADPAVLIEESFVFLLEREPKEAIMKRFELPVIERYFPEYRGQIGTRLGE
jgi:hypothetical protein